MTEPLPIPWAQLCAMARAHLLRDRTIDDAEWSARIKGQAAAMRRPYPTPEQITRAMRAVERALQHDGILRSSLLPIAPSPMPGLLRQPAAPRAEEPPPGPADHARRAQLLAQVAQVATTKAMKPARPTTRGDVRLADKVRAMRILQQAIVEQSTRCDAAEQAACGPATEGDA